MLEAVGVGAEQSAGLARIFRIAHADPRLCALALEARERWRAWERELGVGRLLGEEGLWSWAATGAAGGAEVGGAEDGAARRGGEPPQAAAMRAAGAPVESLSRRDIEARIPLLARRSRRGTAGSGTRSPARCAIRRTLQALAARLDVRRETVTDLDALEADAILVCAGLGTADSSPRSRCAPSRTCASPTTRRAPPPA